MFNRSCREKKQKKPNTYVEKPPYPIIFGHHDRSQPSNVDGFFEIFWLGNEKEPLLQRYPYA
jgi:hypothetical protein